MAEKQGYEICLERNQRQQSKISNKTKQSRFLELLHFTKNTKNTDFIEPKLQLK